MGPSAVRFFMYIINMQRKDSAAVRTNKNLCAYKYFVCTWITCIRITVEFIISDLFHPFIHFVPLLGFPPPSYLLQLGIEGHRGTSRAAQTFPPACLGFASGSSRSRRSLKHLGSIQEASW